MPSVNQVAHYDILSPRVIFQPSSHDLAMLFSRCSSRTTGYKTVPLVETTPAEFKVVCFDHRDEVVEQRIALICRKSFQGLERNGETEFTKLAQVQFLTKPFSHRTLLGQRGFLRQFGTSTINYGSFARGQRDVNVEGLALFDCGFDVTTRQRVSHPTPPHSEAESVGAALILLAERGPSHVEGSAQRPSGCEELGVHHTILQYGNAAWCGRFSASETETQITELPVPHVSVRSYPRAAFFARLLSDCVHLENDDSRISRFATNCNGVS